MQDESAVLEPQEDASESSEDNKDTSVDTSIDTSEAEAEVEEVEVEQEIEAESSTADEENVEEKTPDPEYGEKVKQRIDKLTENFRSSERQSAEKDLEIAELHKKLEAVEPKSEPFKTLEDFEYDNTQYQSYMATEIDKRATSAAEKVARGFQTKVDTESKESAFRIREKEFAADHPDYEKLVYGEVDGQRGWQASEFMARELVLSEMGEELTYHLASNPDIASEIARLPDRETVRRMARLEDQLIAEQAKAKEKTVSKAPPPTPKIPSGSSGLQKGFYEGMSDKDFDKERRKQIANR